QVLDLMRQVAVEVDDEIDGARLRAVEAVEQALEARACRLGRAVDDKVGLEVLAVVERPVLGGLFDEKIERIVDRHVGDDVDLDLELGDELWKYVAGQPVAIRILLVIHEMPGRRHLQRMRNDSGAAVGRRAEADDLRTERDRPVVSVVRQVMNGGSNRHGRSLAPRGFLQLFTFRCAAQSPQRPVRPGRRPRRGAPIGRPSGRPSRDGLWSARYNAGLRIVSSANPQAASVSRMCGGTGASTSIAGALLASGTTTLRASSCRGTSARAPQIGSPRIGQPCAAQWTRN